MTSRARLPWREARRRAGSAAALLDAEIVPLEHAVGRVLREPVVAALDVPHYASAAMDGWAVSGPGPWALRATGPLASGQATPIVTGGLLPAGADAVLRSEYCRVDGGLLVAVQPDSKDHIRPPAEEAHAGETLVAAGTRLSPAHVALIAAATADRIEVSRIPRVRTVLTGDEVVTAGLPQPGQVRDSFGATLPAILGILGAHHRGSVRIDDDRDATIQALLAPEVDLVVTTGGTGGSRADHVRLALDELGADFLIPGLLTRPGGPTLLARLPAGTLVLGLAGNPLAAMLGLLTLGDALIAGFTGRTMEPFTSVPVPDSILRHPQSTRLVPVRAGLHEVAWTGSAMMRGLADATAVLVVPPEGDGDLIPLPWS